MKYLVIYSWGSQHIEEEENNDISVVAIKNPNAMAIIRIPEEEED